MILVLAGAMSHAIAGPQSARDAKAQAQQRSATQMAAKALRIEDIRYGMNAGKIRVVVDVNRPVDFRAFLINNPNRVALDVPTASWAVSRAKSVNNQLVKAYRSGDISGNLTRIVFDIGRPAIISNAFSLPKDQFSKDRIVIDLEPVSQNLFNAQVQVVVGKQDLAGGTVAPAPASTMRIQENARIEAESYMPTTLPIKNPRAAAQVGKSQIPKSLPSISLPPAKTPPAARRKYNIIIDAGHGGQDPGAIGQGGVYEKHITLATAKIVKRKLEDTGRYKVVLTRSNDTYIKLRERVNVARREKGDLFISLHADKIDRKAVRGASIYTLSENASDAETERLADSENNSGVVAGVDLATESAEVADILLDLAMREKMNESNLFARYIGESFRREKVKLLPNSHRAAGFAVLKAPDIPSVLIEMGFLSNADEVKLLNSSAFQAKIGDALADGIDAYFRKIEALSKI